MSLSDSDYELLESHLDGELSVAEDEALRDRMNIEPDLATALETLRSEREARVSTFRAMEPDDETVERFNRSASREIQRLDRDSFWQRTSQRLRIASAAAACLLIGFSVGRIAKSGVLNRAPLTPDDRPGGTLVAEKSSSGNPVEVVLTDDRGHEIGVQRFNSTERAREFVNDVDRWQQRQRQLQDAQIVPASAEQF